MGDAIVVIPPPSPPPPPRTAWRNITASVARSRVGLAVAAAAMFLLLAILWVLFASLAAMRIQVVACGEDCPILAGAARAMVVASMSFWVVLPLAAAAWLICKTEFGTQIEEVPDSNGITSAELVMLCSLAFLFLGLVGVLMKSYSPNKGSLREIVSSVIIDVAAFGSAVLYCCIILPSLAMYVWKMVFVLWQRI